MTAAELTGLLLTLLVMLVGLAGAVLPGLPGPPVILLAALCHRLWFGDRGAAGWVLVLLALMTALSLVLDLLATAVGARKLGSTWRGVMGATLGALLGLLWMPLGLLLGPLLGAFLLELSAGKEWREAGKAGAGAALGLLAGVAGKLGVCLGMIALFCLHLLLRL
ncbi:MAG: DUF456 family protein, partial [Verrucomicrobiota bacterium]